MKIIFAFLVSLAVVAAVSAAEADLLAKPAQCLFCSNGILSKNKSCVCPNSVKAARKYACGPACTAVGYCCESTKCPSCTGDFNPTADSACTCDAPASRIFRKYPCGPACTAAGYCCDSQIIAELPAIA